MLECKCYLLIHQHWTNSKKAESCFSILWKLRISHCLIVSVSCSWLWISKNSNFVSILFRLLKKSSVFINYPSNKSTCRSTWPKKDKCWGCLWFLVSQVPSMFQFESFSKFKFVSKFEAELALVFSSIFLVHCKRGLYWFLNPSVSKIWILSCNVIVEI